MFLEKTLDDENVILYKPNERLLDKLILMSGNIVLLLP
jgi:hypothetical protein